MDHPVTLRLSDWLVALASGTPWRVAHAFTNRFLRFSAQSWAYLALLADPYPGFLGNRPYPVDVELPGPQRQSRWTVAFRFPLALPALLLAGVLTMGAWDPSSDSFAQFGGLVSTVAFLGWFAALARARMPRGMRDAGAYGLLYATQAYAYMLLVTDRYPNSDPLTAVPDLPADAHPIRLNVDDDRRRGRLTTFFRLLLAIPHMLWAGIWGIAVLAAVVASWFIQVVAGRPHPAIQRFVASYLRYTTHVYAYLYLAAEPFPQFGGEDEAYPVQLSIGGPERQERLTVIFRFVLAVPALLITTAYTGIALVAAFLGWFAVMARGEMPLGLRNTIALWLRYNQQTAGYLFLLTERYPHSGPTAPSRAVEQERPVFLPPDALATT